MELTMLLETHDIDLELTIPTEDDNEKDISGHNWHRHGVCGVDVPPILLQETPDGTYLVRDGHHRRLVAIARRDATIKAYICPVGFQSERHGTPFPFYHVKGEANVMWRGREWDYGDMWAGRWREILGEPYNDNATYGAPEDDTSASSSSDSNSDSSSDAGKMQERMERAGQLCLNMSENPLPF
jgi:hypothetical protein